MSALHHFLVSLAMLLGLVAATPAQAANAPPEFYGVIAANDPGGADLARMGAGRVGTLRLNFVWAQVQSGPQAPYDWGRYDVLIGGAAQQGIRVLPTVYGSPSWAAKHENYPPSTANRARYREFLTAAAARYGNGGTFWRDHPELPAMPIHDWQLWNEPNLIGFWGPKVSAKKYVGLLRDFSRGIRSGDPSAQVVLAGLFPDAAKRSTVIGVPLEKYLPTIYRQKRVKPLFDAIALHPYATTPRRVLADIKRARAIMARFKDRKTHIWLTETGWTTGGAPSPLTVKPARQAGYLTRMFDLLAANRTRYKISGAIWYSWRDVPGSAWFNHTGLFTQEGNAKPAWSAFVRLTGGSPGSGPLP